MFEERERGYEAKWAHDAEALFRIMARRDNKLGEWAAARMNMLPMCLPRQMACKLHRRRRAGNFRRARRSSQSMHQIKERDVVGADTCVVGM